MKRKTKFAEKAATAILIVTIILSIVYFAGMVWVSIFALNHPEAIGDWFRRAIGG